MTIEHEDSDGDSDGLPWRLTAKLDRKSILSPTGLSPTFQSMLTQFRLLDRTDAYATPYEDLAKHA